MNGSTVYVCVRAGRRAGWDPRHNTTQHKDRLSAAVTHRERIKIYMYATAVWNIGKCKAKELRGTYEQDISTQCKSYRAKWGDSASIHEGINIVVLLKC